ncbi:MAG: hypothetical protein H7A23_14695 [Leptospiraceae bacterium]|nr:hypothetical protein [Leptospiraceae bacterium]MCP5495798.1 hypothetical protein [Leptospiraceae bacterium]
MTTIRIITEIQEEIEKRRLEIENLEQGNASIQFSNIDCSQKEIGQIMSLLIQNRENRIEELLKKLESIQFNE